MNILVLHSELGVLRGGGENYTRNLFSAFVNRGHRVSVAFVTDGRGHYPFALPAELEPIPITGWWSKNFGQKTLSALGKHLSEESGFKKFWSRVQDSVSARTFRWHNLRFQRRIANQFSRRWEEFDAVYVHGDTPLAHLAAQQRPTVLRLPGPVGPDMAPMLRGVHAVCANGDALVRIRSFLNDHATELPPGVNMDVFKPGRTTVRSRLSWSKAHRVVGYVGRLTRLKGVDLLAAAFKKLSTTRSDFRLLLVGSGEEGERLRKDLAKEIAENRVHIERDIDHAELAEWYRAMDLLVMPSRYENFSNAILEAMSCGVPFLASAVGGNKTLAETGSGWLFEADSMFDLASRVEKIFGQPLEIKKLGETAQRYSRTCHSWAVSAQRLEEIIETRLGVKV